MEDKEISHIRQFFAYEHLPPELQERSRPFSDVADRVVQLRGHDAAHAYFVQLAAHVERTTPGNPETLVAIDKILAARKAYLADDLSGALRLLLEGKDAAVRAALAKK